MYWTNLWQPYVHVQQNIFEKTLILVGSSHLYASFGTFYVQISQLFEAQWDFKLPEELEISNIFLRKQTFYHFPTFFKDSLCLEWLTNLDANGAKIWTTDFYMGFFKNILLYKNDEVSKVRSVHIQRRSTKDEITTVTLVYTFN